MNASCVEDTVMSAGGPKLACVDQGLGKRDLGAKMMKAGESAKNKQDVLLSSSFEKETRKKQKLADNAEATAGNIASPEILRKREVGTGSDTEAGTGSGSASKPKQHEAGPKSLPDFEDPKIAESYSLIWTDFAKIEHSYHGPNWQHSRRNFKARGPVARPNPPPNIDDPDVATGHEPYGVELSSIEHSYTPAQWSDKHTRGLRRLKKRACFPVPSTNGVPPIVCDPILPGVDECNNQIRARGNVGPKISLFYTG